MKSVLNVMRVLGFLVVFGLGMSCSMGDDDPEGNNNIDSDADWTNYQTAGTYSIRVRNESNRDLIAFKTSLSEATKLGGVRKNETDHGFRLNTNLFNQSTDFSIIFVTVEQYQANKGNLAILTQKPFTRLFAVYNQSGTNETPFIVSGSLGGDNSFILQNMTGFDVEFRLNSPRGTTLGYAPHETNNTILYMNTGNYIIYPVFKKYNKLRDEILTIYPRAVDGIPLGDELSFTGGTELSINVNNYSGNANLSSGAAILVVQNGSKNGITVYRGNTIMKTETGISTINAGDERSFTILMASNGNNTYEPTYNLAGWKIVNQGVYEEEIPKTVLDADYRYTVMVTGNWNQGTQAVAAPEKGSAKVTNLNQD